MLKNKGPRMGTSVDFEFFNLDSVQNKNKISTNKKKQAK